MSSDPNVKEILSGADGLNIEPAVVVFGQIAESLENVGYAIAPNFIPHSLVEALRRELRELDELNELRPGTIGRGAGNHRWEEIRSDRIRWLDDASASAAALECLTRFDRLRRTINERLFLGLFEFECHLSMYGAGARFARHLDQFKDVDHRRVSCVLYLNEQWDDEDGGELRIHFGAAGGFRDVKPCGGTLAIFLSDRFEHEVLPARKSRFSLTGWFKVRA